MKDAWPGPDVGQKKSPAGHKEIIHKLKNLYIDNYFPNVEKVKVDYKRFVLTSNSQEMGFLTNFYKVSKADNFKYNLFCHTWIDYNQEEDIIQVGKINFFSYLRSKILFSFLKLNFHYLSVAKEEKETREMASQNRKAA